MASLFSILACDVLPNNVSRSIGHHGFKHWLSRKDRAQPGFQRAYEGSEIEAEGWTRTKIGSAQYVRDGYKLQYKDTYSTFCYGIGTGGAGSRQCAITRRNACHTVTLMDDVPAFDGW